MTHITTCSPSLIDLFHPRSRRSVDVVAGEGRLDLDSAIDVDRVICGLVANRSDMRAGILCLDRGGGIGCSAPPSAKRGVLEELSGVDELRILFVRDAGAWLVAAGRDAEQARDVAADWESALLEGLCTTCGWRPAAVPLGTLVVTRVGRTHDVPSAALIAGHDLPWFAARVGAMRPSCELSEGLWPSEQANALIADILALGHFMPFDAMHSSVVLPRDAHMTLLEPPQSAVRG